ncbi:WapI family immunity protein [Hyphomicrobium sp.]|uniref:WapI family immunity protein n=1 Tax=Hyphomicrobium sp. TaxID=82 RepID=UPI003F7271A4
MDIILATHCEIPALAFRDWRKFGDASGYVASLDVRTDWIAAERDFYFEVEPLQKFIDALEAIDRTLVGTARLKPLWEEPFVEISGNGRGEILVSGLMIENGHRTQQVRFAFETDQTCLAPLIASLKAAA